MFYLCSMDAQCNVLIERLRIRAYLSHALSNLGDTIFGTEPVENEGLRCGVPVLREPRILLCASTDHPHGSYKQARADGCDN